MPYSLATLTKGLEPKIRPLSERSSSPSEGSSAFLAIRASSKAAAACFDTPDKDNLHPAKEYGIDQEYITPYTPEQNGMIERFFRTLKEECIWQSSFKSRDEAFIVIAAWMDKYHKERPHSALGYLTPEEYRNGVQAA